MHDEPMSDDMWVLKDSERDLVRETEPDRMAELSEDDLLALHKRVRRARNKHMKNYRRGASKRVEEAGARGAAGPRSDKARLRAAVFEETLSVVSARLAEVAHEAAVALKEERLERAQAGRSTGPDTGPAGDDASLTGKARSHQKTTGGLKRDASSASQGARRQAKRDSR
jgi:hypothetical protein